MDTLRNMALVDWLDRGGPLMLVLLVASVVALATIIERMLYYRKVEAKKKPFLKELYDCLDLFQTEAAEELCRRHPGPLAEIANSAIAASDRDREPLKEIIEEAGNREIPKLEQRLGILATIAHISPLLGLLGTVIGIIDAFQEFQISSESGALPGPGLMAGGIWQALITTVAGLTLGISVQVIYNYLFTQKERLVKDLENAAFEILEIISSKKSS